LASKPIEHLFEQCNSNAPLRQPSTIGNPARRPPARTCQQTGNDTAEHAPEEPMPHLSRRTVITAAAVLAVAGLAAGLALFQPWRLFTDTVVDEPLPAATPAAGSPAASTPATSAPDPSLSTNPSSTPAPTVSARPGTTAAPSTVTLARGSFVSHEHRTRGTASVIRLADGSRILRIEGLDTSDGPDLHVWLSDAAPDSDWNSFDDGKYTDLGKLKGNKGSQNYVLPSGLDLTPYRSVSIWCDRFNVSFGAALLTPA